MSIPRSVNLINPPSASGTLANREGAAGLGVVYPLPASFFYPPHTVATVAASLRRAGFAVHAYDGIVGLESDNWAHADVVAVFVSWATLETDLSYIVGLRRRTDAKLVAFGPATRFVIEKVLGRAPLDALLIGEPEGFVASAVRWIADAGRTTATRTLRPEDFQGTACDDLGYVCDLDSVPFPAWD